MANSNLYQYHGPGGQKLYGYRREYKGRQLRKKGFKTKADAEHRLRQAMSDVDALERGEIRVKPTTLQEALDLANDELQKRQVTVRIELSGELPPVRGDRIPQWPRQPQRPPSAPWARSTRSSSISRRP